MDSQAGLDRVERELVRLGEHGLDTPSWFRAADELLDRAVGFDGSCWQTNNPATALITSHLTLNLPSGGLPAAGRHPGRWPAPHGSRPAGHPRAAGARAGAGGPGPHGQIESLTPAARHWRGRSTRQIARALSISPYTVQEHLTAVFDKVGVRSRGELVGQVFFRHWLPQIPD